MTGQKEYWDKKIKSWTRIAYEKKTDKAGVVETLANFFRGAITARMEVALKEIGPEVRGKVVLDLGCGLGDFCFRVLKYRPRKVIGLDISEVAIKQARTRARKLKLEKKIVFIEGNAAELEKMPEFDVAVGLGFIDYLNEEDLKKLFRLFSERRFFFSFFEKKFSLLNLIHAFYVKWQKCPGAFKYSREEMAKIIPLNIKYGYFEKDKMVFITNVPGKF